jgi:hypothetical protein
MAFENFYNEMSIKFLLSHLIRNLKIINGKLPSRCDADYPTTKYKY